MTAWGALEVEIIAVEGEMGNLRGNPPGGPPGIPNGGGIIPPGEAGSQCYAEM